MIEEKSEIEELKKKFILDESSFEEEKISEMLKKIIDICETDKAGFIRFKIDVSSDKEKIKYILVARFLANKIEENINKIVSLVEIEKMLGKGRSDKGISGRMSELRKEGVINNEAEGCSIKPHKISEILGV